MALIQEGQSRFPLDMSGSMRGNVSAGDVMQGILLLHEALTERGIKVEFQLPQGAGSAAPIVSPEDFFARGDSAAALTAMQAIFDQLRERSAGAKDGQRIQIVIADQGVPSQP